MNPAAVVSTVVPDLGWTAALRFLKALLWRGGLLAIFISSPGVVAAAPHTFNLSGVVFSDGATASGSFTYDSVTILATNWSVTVTTGPNFPALTYTPANSQFTQVTLGAGAQPTLQFFIPPFVGGRALRLTPQTVLDGTNPNDPINLAVAGGSGAVECFNCNPFRFITAGSFVLAAAVPTMNDGARIAFAALILLMGTWVLRRRAGAALAGHPERQHSESRPDTQDSARSRPVARRRFRLPPW